MRIRRAMFRLWILASVIWVGIIGNIGYHEWRTVPQPVKLYLLPNAASAAASDFYIADNIFNRLTQALKGHIPSSNIRTASLS